MSSRTFAITLAVFVSVASAAHAQNASADPGAAGMNPLRDHPTTPTDPPTANGMAPGAAVTAVPLVPSASTNGSPVVGANRTGRCPEPTQPLGSSSSECE
jgi:hypothetical protein